MVKKIYNIDYIQKLTDICNVMYTDTCDIYSDIEVTDEVTKLSSRERQLIHENISCRASYKSSNGSYLKGNTTFSETIANKSKNIKIFMQYDIDVKIGDVIVLNKRGKLYKYIVSTLPNIFSSHQEFYCELIEV